MNRPFVKVSVDYRETSSKLNFLARQQLPFAFASALTKTAVAAHKQVQNRTRKIYHLHGEFIPKGIRVRPAFKAEIIKYGFTSAHVLTAPVISNWMPLHEDGQDKTSVRGRNLAVPMPDLLKQGAAKTSRGAIRANLKPGALLDRSKRAKANPKARGKGKLPSPVFMIRSRKTNLVQVVQRWGPERGDLRTLYQFQPRARIKPNWLFGATVQRVAEKAFPAYLERELAQALATARAV